MSAADYIIELYSPDGTTHIGKLAKPVRIEYVNRVNDMGGFEIEFARYDLAANLYWVDIAAGSRVVIWRRPQDSKRFDIDFAGLVRKYQASRRASQDYITLSGYNYNYLLDSRIVAEVAGSAHADKDDYADDAIKAVVREQLGADATDSARDLTSAGFTVQPDLSAGTNVKKQMAHMNVLQACQELAEASKATSATAVYFGYVPTGNGTTAEFRTAVGQWGQDVSGETKFALWNGNMRDPVYTIDRSDEVNFVYGGGSGVGSWRVAGTSAYDTPRLSASATNRREAWYDARNETDAAVVTSGMAAALYEGRPMKSLTFDVVETSACRLGVNYHLGSKVAGQYGAFYALYHVAGYWVRVAAGNDSIKVSLEVME